MKKNAENIVDEVISLCYYMRGSVTYDEMMTRSIGERAKMSAFIKDRLESQKKSMYPVY